MLQQTTVNTFTMKGKVKSLSEEIEDMQKKPTGNLRKEKESNQKQEELLLATEETVSEIEDRSIAIT